MSITSAQPTTIPHELLSAFARSNTPSILTLLDARGEIAEVLSYAELMAVARRWQAALAAIGLAPGDRVVVALRHGAHLYGAYLGALLGGFLPAMFAFPSPKVSEEAYFSTLPSLIDVTAPRAFITFDALRPKIAAMLADRPVHVLSADGLPPEGSQAGTDAPQLEVSAASPAFLQYSSGTTGLKKGVEISHAALLWQVEQYGRALALRRNDIIVSWLPLYHDMGLICGFFLPLLTGTPVVALDPFDWVARPTMLLEAITRHRATLCWQPNFAYALLARSLRHADVHAYDLSSMRGWINCSEPVQDESHRAFQRALASAGLGRRTLATCYAMAETTFAVTASPIGQPPSVDAIDGTTWLQEQRAVPAEPGAAPVVRLVSSGYPLPGIHVAIQGPDGSVLAERHVGEIVVRSPALANGYLGRDEHTAQLSDPFRTGDLGYLAAGELYVTGRAKDVIIVAGRNIYPHDAEAIAHEAAGVTAGRVVAFGVADEEHGTEQLVVLAEADNPEHEGTQQMIDAIRKRLSEQLGVSAQVVPVRPRTLRKSTSGKLSRAANRADFVQGVHDIRRTRPAVARETSTPSALSLARDAIAEVLGPAEAASLAADDRLVTSGRLSSLDVISLVLALERRMGATIPQTSLELAHLDSCERIARLVEHTQRSLQEAATLLEHNGTFPVDDRQKAALEFVRHAGRVDLLLVGSSRSSYVSPRVAGTRGWTAFNFWSISARAEDYYCALRFALDEQARQGGRLRAVLLGIDAEALNPAAEGIEPRLAYSPLLSRYLDEETLSSGLQAPDGDPDSRFANVRWQLRIARDEPGFFSHHDAPQTPRIATPDARVPHPRRVEQADDRNAAYALRFAGFDSLAAWRVTYLHRLLDLVREEGIALICYVTPVHEVLDAYLARTTPYRQRLAEIRTLVTKRCPEAVWLDTGTPAHFGGDAEDFINGAHIAQANGERLTHFLVDHLERLLAGRKSA